MNKLRVLIILTFAIGCLVFARDKKDSQRYESNNLRTENQYSWIEDKGFDDNKLDRKRSHKRRRKIRRPIKGLR